ncbi:MAG: hypothetical protein CM15mP80_07480 [Alphaproteobacteria bacterium]|nr:MAG: hypothetical protein CM15mP80_07480 [Alphaproteobacteria bacterium]
MRIKVNPKEKSLTGDKMERGGGGCRKSYEKGAQLCTFMTTIITCCSQPVFKLRRFSPWQTNATFCVKLCFCVARLLTRRASVPAAPLSMLSVQLPYHLKQWPFLHASKKVRMRLIRLLLISARFALRRIRFFADLWFAIK